MMITNADLVLEAAMPLMLTSTSGTNQIHFKVIFDTSGEFHIEMKYIYNDVWFVSDYLYGCELNNLYNLQISYLGDQISLAVYDSNENEIGGFTYTIGTNPNDGFLFDNICVSTFIIHKLSGSHCFII